MVPEDGTPVVSSPGVCPPDRALVLGKPVPKGRMCMSVDRVGSYPHDPQALAVFAGFPFLKEEINPFFRPTVMHTGRFKPAKSGS